MSHQDNRDLSFTFESDSGANFKLISFTFDEALSTPYRGHIKLASFNYNIRATDMVDKGATLNVFRNGKKERSFHGIVESFTVGDSGFDYTFYEVILVPSLARLALRHNSRIFQEQDIPTIIETLLGEMGIGDYAFALRNSHETREYCVQYRETDLEFLERLCAEEGIFYYFEHNAGNHTVIFADDNSVVDQIETPALYNMMSGGVNEEMTVRQFAMRSTMSFTNAILKDRCFKAPSFDFLNSAYGRSMEYQNSDYEYFDYPGRYKDQSVGSAFAQTRIHYLRRDALTATGLSDIPAILPGFMLNLTEHLEDAFNQRWLVTKIRHEGEQPQSLEHQGIDGMTRYSNEFSVIPGNIQWKPTPNPRPVVHGPHIAVVTGPADEEIYVDEFGRVKVKFPWDRYQSPEPQSDSGYTCWIRATDGWAGPGYGMIALPRVGQEVIVSFMEGDPDQPIITGRTYHATNRQPYKLPDHKTITGIRTQTHQGEGYNELYFDDENEKQLIYLRAEKDLDIKVKNVKNERIDYDHQVSIGNDEKIDIANDRILTVEGEQHLKTTGDHHQLIEGDKNLTVKGDFAQAITGATGLHSGEDIVLESDATITCKVGGSFVVIHSGGVHLQGPVVTINEGGSPGDVVTPATPKILETAVGEGSAFLFHCPKQGKAKQDTSGLDGGDPPADESPDFDFGGNASLPGSGGAGGSNGFGGGLGGLGNALSDGAFAPLSDAENLLNLGKGLKDNPLSAANAIEALANQAGLTDLAGLAGSIASAANFAGTVEEALNDPLSLLGALGGSNFGNQIDPDDLRTPPFVESSSQQSDSPFGSSLEGFDFNPPFVPE